MFQITTFVAVVACIILTTGISGQQFNPVPNQQNTFFGQQPAGGSNGIVGFRPVLPNFANNFNSGRYPGQQLNNSNSNGIGFPVNGPLSSFVNNILTQFYGFQPKPTTVPPQQPTNGNKQGSNKKVDYTTLPFEIQNSEDSPINFLDFAQGNPSSINQNKTNAQRKN